MCPPFCSEQCTHGSMVNGIYSHNHSCTQLHIDFIRYLTVSWGILFPSSTNNWVFSSLYMSTQIITYVLKMRKVWWLGWSWEHRNGIFLKIMLVNGHCLRPGIIMQILSYKNAIDVTLWVETDFNYKKLGFAIWTYTTQTITPPLQ